MATIGSFTRKPDGTYEGSLATLTMQVGLRLMPLEEKTSDKAPDYRGTFSSSAPRRGSPTWAPRKPRTGPRCT